MHEVLQILYYTPIYVWFLLGYLLRVGWKARKTHVISWNTLLVMPSVISVWSVYTLISNGESLPLILGLISMAMGVGLGLLTVRRLALRFDKQRKRVEVAGHWMPLILSVSVFALKYCLGAAYGLYPELKGHAVFNTIEHVSTCVSGMFLGRLMGYWRKYRVASHVDLADVKAS